MPKRFLVVTAILYSAVAGLTEEAEQHPKGCHTARLLNDVMARTPAAASCSVQIVTSTNGSPGGSECFHKLIRRPIYESDVDSAMATEIFHNICNFVVIGYDNRGEEHDLRKLFNRALSAGRARSNYYMIVADSNVDLTELPSEMDSLANVVVVIEPKEGERGGAALYTRGVFADLGLRPANLWSEKGFSTEAPIFPTWTEGRPLMIGHEISVAAVPIGQFVFYSNDNTEVKGLEVHLVRAVADHFGIGVRTSMLDWDGTGGLNETSGAWTGMFGMLQRGELDIAIGAYSTRPERQTIIDYAPLPLYPFPNSITFYTTLPQHSSTWYGFLNPLDFKAWIVLVVTVIVFATALSLVFRQHHLFATFALIINSLTNMGDGDISPKSLSQYTLVLLWILPTFVLNLAYSSSLMASLTVPSPGKTIDTWEELAASGYTIVTDEYMVFRTYFETATLETNPIYYKIYQLMSKQDPAVTYQSIFDNFNNLWKLVQTVPKLAVISLADDSHVGWDELGNPILHQSKVERDYPFFTSSIFRKNFPFFEPFYMGLLWLRDTGASSMTNDRALMEYGSYNQMQRIADNKNSDLDPDGTPNAISLSDLQGAFYILLAGCVISSLAFWMLEDCTKNSQRIGRQSVNRPRKMGSSHVGKVAWMDETMMKG